ncbi:MAG TPA: hypothetical protein PLF40_16765, partial [Kofleriaceae bacterium]|nr:hypothetical protein [Kofleriaceae bacterium]
MLQLYRDFFSHDLVAVAAANRALNQLTVAEITNPQRWWNDGAPHPRGLWGPVFGTVEAPQLASIRVRALHPAAIHAIAAFLNVSAATLADFSTWDSNNEELFLDRLARELVQRGAPLQLSEAAIVEVVPVPPPWQRPFIVATPPARDAWCGPINELWLAITWAALQNRRLLEIGSVPLIIVNNEQQRASALLATLFNQLNTPGTQPNTRPTAFALPVSPVPTAWPKAKAANVAGVLWLDAERLYVQRGMEDQIIHCNGELEARLPSCGRIVRSKVENRLYFEQFFGFSQAAPTPDEMATLFSLNETAPDGDGTPLGAPVAILDVTTLQWQRSGEEIEVNPWLTGDCPSFREQDNDDDDDLY